MVYFSLEKFSKKLKTAREKAGKSKQAVLRDMLTKFKIDMSRPTYDSYEQGKVEPRISIVALLANEFGVGVDYFLN